ncbi:MAG: DUF305 domain-containing protein [Gammaproteobacteria bacterium]|nr:DUF305 domain-containing protein [Gammaproteobacteria bacterium]MYH86223.1 DUF305 domain-containing protein [Gammaproteobacteria bacterium]MYK05917.1 DUF305 domain-containing protein [Gammaproteobacteria bacterium]
MTFRFLFAALALAVSVPAIAQVPIIQPGLPGQPSRQISAEEASDLAGLQFSEADVRFMQGMISHHRQAMEMSVLVDDRSNREAVEALAERISLSQEDEISMMAGWLEDRGFEAPAADAHHDPDYMLMPGMLSPEEMEQLEAAEGFEFDSLFLNFMIDHHEGALVMVENLLDQPGSAQDSELYRFTTDVTSDQTSEIERMITMLSGFSPDPRVALTPGFRDAGEAALNMRLVASLPKPEGFFDPANPSGLPNRDDRDQEETLAPDPDAPDEPAAEPVSDPAAAQNVQETPVAEDEEDDEDSEPRPSLLNFGNTDLVFTGNVLVAGNYHGYNAYDISNPTVPQLLSSVVCPGGQGDVSIVGDLLIMSVEQTRGRLDCGLQGVAEPESDERFRGIRIFDVSDFRMPMQVGAVQTCRGSHTHTVVTDPDDAGNIYVYGSGTSFVRDEEELAGCSDESPFENPESSLYSIDVIRIPVDAPGEAAIVNRPFIFSDPETGVAAGLWEGGDHGPDTQETRMTNQCHDITAFPEIGLAAGACSGNGILLDISDAENPERVDEVIDPGFAYWHSATFNNDGTKVIFTDEWGGGGRPRCRASDPLNWGADAIYDIVDGQMEYRSHYKMSAPQTETENCVAHNGSLVPVPGRDIFVQAWYQGGVSVVDFTDSANPVEIAFFDRGPIDEEELISGGYWSTYFYNGYIYGTEIARGLDVLQLQPSDFLTENEIAAASLPHGAVTFNAQQQTMFRWPAEPVVARAYLDQLARSESLSAAQRQDLSEALDEAQDALDSGADNNAVAGRLEDLAEEYESASSSASGAEGSRLAALADTLTGIADRL